jgi:Glycosyltransferase Family 4
MMKPRVLVIVFTNLRYDIRVKRQVDFLARRCDLTICCADADPGSPHRIVKLPVSKPGIFRKAVLAALLLLRRFSQANLAQYPFIASVKKQLNTAEFDLIIANDVETLPLAFSLKRGNCKIIFDAHEYAPRHFEDRLWWKILFQPLNIFLCRKYIPQTDGMITVSKSLADEYERNFGKSPLVITNAANFANLSPVQTKTDSIRLVHQGSVGRSRRIELIIQMMDYLPAHFTLDLMLVSSAATMDYMNELKVLASKDSRITFVDPVPIDRVIPTLQQYDIGIILAPPINFNYIYGLPNKLYDYVQARIGTLTSPTIEIARMVTEYRLGLVGEDFTPGGMARKLKTITREEINEFKLHAHQAASELSAEKNELLFGEFVQKILNEDSKARN